MTRSAFLFSDASSRETAVTARKTIQPDDYGRLIEPLLGQAAGYARAILRNRTDAEDAVQQAALRGLERSGTFDPTRPFKGWWFTILRNCCIDTLRHRQAARTVAIEGHEPVGETAGPGDSWQVLANALAALSDEHREILRLRYFAGLAYRELASALDIPEGTVMSRLHLARKALARNMRLEEL
ncbi:MAG: sigma-70 family RNA polymerase sigma factor [Planctomycetes bacterium]|nr:sigma-70 family RNA polymerase sigma factor [Planctomycetota bacterium]